MRFANPSGTVEGFHGERISVLRIHGKAYTSDDKNLSAELTRIFEYMRLRGVTEELLVYFQQL